MSPLTKCDVLGLDAKGGGGFLDGLDDACVGLHWNFVRKGPADGFEPVWVTGAHVIVAHVWEEVWQEIVAHARQSCVCIRVQSGGFQGKDVPGPNQDKERLLLHLIPAARKVGSDEWVRILKGVTDVDEVQRLTGSTESFLDSYFRHRGVDHLLALAVLCQGYLAVQGELKDKEWGPRGIRQALEQMGWTQFMDSGCNASKRIGERLQQNRSQLKAEVINLKWWQEALAAEDPILACEKEWGWDTKGWDTVFPLLKMIKDGGTVPEPGEMPHPVAIAFLGLCERLSGSRR